MFKEKIGVSILTNGNRSGYLSMCVASFLENAYYRPLVVGIFDNGSTDDTPDICRELSCSGYYGVEWRIQRSEIDLGCAEGTNISISLVKEAKYILHIESDFEHIPTGISGEDKMWLHRVVEFMEKGECDYMYLRRMVNEYDILQHWWSQWMGKIDKTEGNYLRCPGFWWSNNPTIFRHEALLLSKTLPLDRLMDGQKGTSGWSKPELEAARPPKAWIHKWGLFVHERFSLGELKRVGCVADSQFGCKYGFVKPGKSFCALCKKALGYKDMAPHTNRFSNIFHKKA